MRWGVCKQQTPPATPAPVKMHRTFASAFDQVLDHRLEGRKAGARRNADDWFFRVRAEIAIAVRKLNFELVTLPQPDQHTLRETASRHMTDMQLRTVAFVGRIRHRKVAGVAVGHEDAEILTGLKPGSNASRKAQPQDADLNGRP